MDKTALPKQFWHCTVSVQGSNPSENAVVNDLTLDRLFNEIVEHWHAGRSLNVGGRIIRKREDVTHIQIVHTNELQEVFSQRYYAEMRNSGICDMVTDPRFLPLSQGTDFTTELLFSELKPELPGVDEQLITTLCQRLPAAARILSNRRANKPSLRLGDEYDVQDLLHSLIRAYVRFSVQEDPIGKIAGTKSSRADVSIEDIGVLIEVKYVRSPDDQKEFVKQFSEDLVLYTKWAPLKTLLYVVYNSADLQDTEALLRLDGRKELGGKVFFSTMILI